jgi:hypothetical protein
MTIQITFPKATDPPFSPTQKIRVKGIKGPAVKVQIDDGEIIEIPQMLQAQLTSMLDLMQQMSEGTNQATNNDWHIEVGPIGTSGSHTIKVKDLAGKSSAVDIMIS